MNRGLERPVVLTVLTLVAVGGELEAKAIPVNDTCTAALHVAFGETVVGNTEGAFWSGEASCGTSFWSPDVWYRFDAAADAHVVADLSGSDYDTVLSVHSGCPGSSGNEIACNDDRVTLESALGFKAVAGTSYWIRVSGSNGAAGPFELHLEPGGAIAGTVTMAETGDPLPGATVRVFSGRNVFEMTSTDATGAYETGGLPEGDFFVMAEADEYQLELYDDFPCRLSAHPYLTCYLFDGTPASVSVGSTTGGIDFALDRLGAITGTITSTVDGAPIADVRVKLYVEFYEPWIPELRFSTVTDGSGAYRVGGLPPDSYFVVTESSAFGGEIYDDIPCPVSFFGLAPCSFTFGTPVEVALNNTTSGIDFDLTPLGAISGTVTEAKDGSPVVGATVKSWHRGEGLPPMHLAVTDAAGRYLLQDLDFGDWFVVTSSPLADEIYGGTPCEAGLFLDCDPEDGVPVPVVLNTTTAGVDFALERYGIVEVTVMDALTGAPVSDLEVSLTSLTAGAFTTRRTAEDGRATFSSLNPDWSYVVKIYDVFGLYMEELYDDVLCAAHPCDLTEGVAFQLGLGDVRRITMALLPSGSTGIAGQVKSFGGQALGGVTVELWSETGDHLASVPTLASGDYFFPDLAPGSYHVSTANGLGLVDQVWRGVVCAPEGCDPTAGTPVMVSDSGASLVANVDFHLSSPFNVFADGFESGNVSAWSGSSEVPWLGPEVLSLGSSRIR